jgi:hypothetical protein
MKRVEVKFRLDAILPAAVAAGINRWYSSKHLPLSRLDLNEMTVAVMENIERVVVLADREEEP